MSELVFVAPAPIDAVAPARVDREADAIAEAVRLATREVVLAGLTPCSAEAARSMAGASPRIVHLAAHATDDAVEFEDAAGFVEILGLFETAEVIARQEPMLVVLNGCDTFELGEQVKSLVSSAYVIGCRGFLPDAAAELFSTVFYRDLLTSGDVRASYARARTRLNSRLGFDGYWLEVGEASTILESGAGMVAPSFETTRARISTGALLGRDAEFRQVYDMMLERRQGPIGIVGPPGSGVTTFLGALASRYGYLYDDVPPVIDKQLLHDARTWESLIAASAQHIGRRTLVRFDDLDEAAESERGEVLTRARAAGEGGNHTVLIASHWPVIEGGTPVNVTLRPLGGSAVASLMRQRLEGPENDPRPLVAGCPPLPACVLEVRTALAEGQSADAAADAAATRLEHRISHLLDRVGAWETAPSLFDCLALLGPRVPAALLRRVMEEASENTTAESAEMARLLKVAGLLRIEGTQDDGKGDAKYFEFLTALLANERGGSTTDLVDEALDFAEAQANADKLRVASDGGWVGNLGEAARAAGRLERVAKLGAQLLGPASAFRYGGSGALALPLAQAAFDCARRIGEVGAAAQVGLVLGESFYKSGDLDSAHQTFLICSELPLEDADALRVFRAVGQIHYRRGEYLRALEWFDRADEHRAGAPPQYAATLDTHRAKALWRLGDASAALDLQQRVVEFLRDKQDPHAMAKAQHELGRILRMMGHDTEAEVAFSSALIGAEAECYDRFLPAPLYELCQLKLDQGDIPVASALAKRLAVASSRSGDVLWEALSSLASARLAFALGRFERASRDVQEALRVAGASHYTQVRADVLRWLASLTGAGADVVKEAPDAVALEISVWTGLSRDKSEKAWRYALEPDRIRSLVVCFESDSATRTLVWEDDRWRCDCALFAKENACSHTAAMQLALDPRGRLASV